MEIQQQVNNKSSAAKMISKDTTGLHKTIYMTAVQQQSAGLLSPA